MRVKNREVVLFSLAGIVVVALLHYLLVVNPTLTRQKVLKGYVVRKQSEVISMLEMKQRWQAFQNARSEAEKMLRQRGEEFTLLTYLEQVSRESGIEKKIRYMKPLSFAEKEEIYKPEAIEMQLEDIDIQRLVDFLYKIEHSRKLLVVDRLKVRPVSKGSDRVLELTLQVKTYRHGEPQGEKRSQVPENAGQQGRAAAGVTVSPAAPPSGS
jgi:Tfp pilus assembly protein PilO